MIHLRIVVEPDKTERALELLERSHSVCNVIFLAGAARQPAGRRDPRRRRARGRERDHLRPQGPRRPPARARSRSSRSTRRSPTTPSARSSTRPARPSDAVVWEEVEARTSENVELSGVFLAFMVLAGLLAAVGIYQDSAILIVGAMVVGPRVRPARRASASRSCSGAGRSRCAPLTALAVGFPLCIAAVYAHGAALQGGRAVRRRVLRGEPQPLEHHLLSPTSSPSSSPPAPARPGMLSLSTAKSGALIGVLISVTTLPAAANVGARRRLPGLGQLTRQHRAARDQPRARSSLAGTAVLAAQRALFLRRRAKHLDDPERRAAGLPATPKSRATTRSRPSS